MKLDLVQVVRCSQLPPSLQINNRIGLCTPSATVISFTVDAGASFTYKPPMICASSRLMTTIDPRGFAVGPEGMRAR